MDNGYYIREKGTRGKRENSFFGSHGETKPTLIFEKLFFLHLEGKEGICQGYRDLAKILD